METLPIELRDDFFEMTEDQFEGYDNPGWLSKEPPSGIPVPRNIKRIADDPEKMSTEHFLLNLGPSHPSTHGALRLVVELDGEKVMSSEAHIGYLHRGIEKLAEHREYTALQTLVPRADYAAGILCETAVAHSIEALGEIEVPERAQWLRALVGEVNRMASHYLWLGPLGLDSGAMAPFLYMTREREACLEILESLAGQRLTYNYVRAGGVAHDMNADAEAKIRKYLKTIHQYLEEHHTVLMKSELFQARTQGISIVTREEALSAGATGFVARASGIDYDLRRDRPYGPYDKLDFNVAVEEGGDTWARVLVRYDELVQSARMIEQLIDGLPEGDYKAKMPRVLRLPKGESYGYVEGARGEIGIHIYSDGTSKPARFRYRSPIQYHLSIADATIPGGFIADGIVGLGSFDFCFGEVDR